MKQANALNILFTLCAGLLLINWAAPETSEGRPVKPSENFYGSLIKQDGAKLEIQHIAVKGKTQGIPLFNKPLRHAPETKNPDTNIGEIMLEKKPRGHSLRNLKNIAEIKIKPAPIFVHREPERYRKLEYVEMVVVSNNKKRTSNSYLININEKLECDQEDGENLITIIVPVTEIDRLIVKGKK